MLDGVTIVAPISFRILTFDGGNGGDALSAGGAGGGLQNVTITSDLNESGNLLHLTGGAGGDSTKTSGGAEPSKNFPISLCTETTSDIGSRKALSWTISDLVRLAIRLVTPNQASGCVSSSSCPLNPCI